MTAIYFTPNKENVQHFKFLSRGDYFFFVGEDGMRLKTDVNQAVSLEDGLLLDDLDEDAEVTPIKAVEIIFEV